MCKRILHIGAILLVLFVLAPAAPARADIAPPQPPYASGIYPKGEVTQVRMMAETVTLDIIGAASQGFPEGYAQVKAIFQMRNLGKDPETMQVYFPLNYFNCDVSLKTRLEDFGDFPPIRDFIVRVNGSGVPFTTVYTQADGSMSWQPQNTDIPCWAHFPASFPAGKDVTVQVDYKVPANNRFEEGYFEYGYILETGAGWNDTIGSAEITVRLPYEINDENVLGYGPKGGTARGNEIFWRLENFEPDQETNVAVYMMKPAIWNSIQTETRNVKTNPNDAEAWGRLGRAYKNSFFLYKGFREDPPGAGLYQKSFDAYTQAVTIKPKDADWHAGFAELICEKAAWTAGSVGKEERQNMFLPCINQIKLALDINPQHELAAQLLEWNWKWDREVYVNMEGPAPDYLILTPTAIPPTPTPSTVPTRRPTVTRRPTSTQTAVPESTSTRPDARAAVTAAAAVEPSKTAVSTARPPANPAGPGVCGAAMMPLGIALLRFLKHRHFLD